MNKGNSSWNACLHFYENIGQVDLEINAPELRDARTTVKGWPARSRILRLRLHQSLIHSILRWIEVLPACIWGTESTETNKQHKPQRRTLSENTKYKTARDSCLITQNCATLVSLGFSGELWGASLLFLPLLKLTGR